MNQLLSSVLFLLVFAEITLADPIAEAKNAHDTGNDKRAIEILQPLADRGNLEAQMHLAEVYRYGHSVPRNSALALSLLKKAAEEGKSDLQSFAEVSIAFMYQRGEGVKTDLEEAARWFQKAAEHGSAIAQYEVGSAYATGSGVPEDFTKARRWFEKAIENGEKTAILGVGALYEYGKGVPQDYVVAYQWYDRYASELPNFSEATVFRDAILKKMDAAQISRAKAAK